MSKLQYHLIPIPAHEPIRTKGNAFWRGESRFLIKGINYFDRRAKDGNSKPTVHDPKIDVLTDEYLPTLRRDVEVLRELGLNTIAVSTLDASKSHEKALRLLAEAGFYVLVKISEDIAAPELPTVHVEFNADFDTNPFYTLPSIMTSLRLVDELTDRPNLLGFMVSGDSLKYPATIKIAEVIRAHVRDIKAFLRTRGGRRVPVGVTNSDNLMLRVPALSYFTAGPASERIDFFAPDSWSWAQKSDFRVSGWDNMVKMLRETAPVPMVLRQFGTCVGKERLWDEVGCLYSPDMTGVFSGGCLYTFKDPGSQGYGVVEVGEDGVVRRKREFERLKGWFRVVNIRDEDELFGEGGGDVGEYDEWEGTFPGQEKARPGRVKWMERGDVPEFPGDWDEVIRQIQQGRKETRPRNEDDGGVDVSGEKIYRLELDD